MKRILWIGMMVVSFAFVACNSSSNTEGNTGNTDNQENQAPAQLASNERYTCTMHHEVMSTQPGTCPKCGMKLEKQKMTPEQEKMLQEGTYLKSKEER